jgi:2-methylcitrate dehydratase PrpD
LARHDIRALMPRITVVEDAEIAAAYPRRRMARLTIALNDGRVIEHFQQTRKGDPEDPLTDAELVTKFAELTSRCLAPEAAAALRDLILSGDRVPGEVPLIRT